MSDYEIFIGEKRDLTKEAEFFLPMITAMSRVPENHVREVLLALDTLRDMMSDIKDD